MSLRIGLTLQICRGNNPGFLIDCKKNRKHDALSAVFLLQLLKPRLILFIDLREKCV